MIKRWILAIIAAGLFCGLIAFIVLISGSNQAQIWEGKVMFESQEEYSTFKRLVGQEDIQIGQITVLSSDTPIVVVFRVGVPREVVFPYGKLVGPDYTFLIGLTITISLVAGALVYHII